MATRYALSGFQVQRDALLGADGANPETDDSAIGSLMRLYKSAKPFPRQSTIVELLRRLREFGKAQFDFFYNGFLEQGPVALEESSLYPPPAVLATILFQIGEDLTIIQRAADQRRVEQLPAASRQQMNKVIGAEANDLKATLAHADLLAFDTLYKAKNVVTTKIGEIGWDPQTTALTYFEKIHASRVVPYAPIAMIGIPLGCLQNDADFLAIPHEVGHYVYHQRTISPHEDPSNRSYIKRTQRYSRWQEELFADVFGALVAGPVLAYDFQELSNVFGREGFLDRSEKHPAPFVRPLIYSHVLRAASSRAHDWASGAVALDKRWEKLLHQRWVDVYDRRWSVAAEWLRQYDFQNTQTLQDLNKLRKDDEANSTWNADTARYLEQVYAALDDLDFSGATVQPNKLVRDVAQEALKKLRRVKRSDWTGDLLEFARRVDALTLAEDKDRGKEGSLNADPQVPFGTFQAWLANPQAELRSPPDWEIQQVSAAAGQDVWHQWVRRERYFGDSEPEQLGKIGAGLPELFDEPADPLVVGLTLPEKPGSGRRTWMQLWRAGGWTTEPPQNVPPGG